MTTIPLGLNAYRRNYPGMPEIRLENRWVEKSPSNLREHTALIARPGTSALATFGGGPIQGTWSKSGMFDEALFVVSGTTPGTLYRKETAALGGAVTTITGTISGASGRPHITWMKGIGYEYLFIADGVSLQYYGGTTAAFTTLTLSGTISSGVDAIQIGLGLTGVQYYTFNNSVAGFANGSAGNPWLVSTAGDPMANLVDAIEAGGTAGTTYSAALATPNALVNAYTDGQASPVPHIRIVAKAAGTVGNSISTTIIGGTHLAFTGTTLAGGGVNALANVPMPDHKAADHLANNNGYVLVNVSNTQQVFFIQPGATTIDPLDFFEKESSPDEIVDMQTIGDQTHIIGGASTENWYATGDAALPFAPQKGRVYARGAIDGTPCVINDSLLLVGNDGVVYQIGEAYGGTAQYGVTRISDNGIEERIRRQLRREQGLTP